MSRESDIDDVLDGLSDSMEELDDMLTGLEGEKNGKKPLFKGWFTKQSSPRLMPLLDLIECILELSESSGFDEKCQKRAAPYTAALAERLHVSPVQAALFSHFVGRGDDQDIRLGEIQSTLKCSPVKMLKYSNDIDVLVKHKLLYESGHRHSQKSYCVPDEILEAVRANAEIKITEQGPLDIDGFFSELETLVDRCFQESMSFSRFYTESERLLKRASHLQIARAIKSYHLTTGGAQCLLLFFCERLVNNDDEDIDFDDLRRFINDTHLYHQAKRSLSAGENQLFECGLIEPTGANGFENREEYRLTAKAREELLAEMDLTLENARMKRGLILCKDIVEKKLYYNVREAKLVDKLAALLQPESFKTVQERLRDKGMRTGFACLFYGKPGTGKTETANMLARKTGRDILLVDIAETKSCWFGESEKQIKKVFDRYKAFVKTNETAPILLFNEADAVISKRKDVTSGNVAQTENAMQNIILQEMETLDGILIATTNLTTNLDKAFERRFLYKIEFEKPVLEARVSIWKSQIPELSEEAARTLAERFEFTGGQIENIARKHTVDSIITGCEVSLSTLIEYCQDEKLDREKGGLLGFHA